MDFKYSKNNGIYLPIKYLTEDKPVSLSEVKQLPNPESLELTPGNIEEIIEKPLVEATRRLMFKNIPTVYSSANGENGVGDSATLGVNYTNLSNANKHIAQKMVQIGSAKILTDYRGSGVDVLDIRIESEKEEPMPFKKVEDFFIKIADKFVMQEKQKAELKMSDIELKLAQMLGYGYNVSREEALSKLHENHGQVEIDEMVEEIRDRYDWGDNPLIGVRKD